MLAMQATVDYNETKERCRSRILQLDLDNAPTNWEDTTKKMFALKSFSRQATSKGTQRRCRIVQPCKITGVTSTNIHYSGAAPAADIDSLATVLRRFARSRNRSQH